MPKFKTDFIKKRLGALPSPWQPTHYRESPATHLEAVEYPETFTDLLAHAPTDPWPDQGDVGTCVGQSGGINLETLFTAYPAEMYMAFFGIDPFNLTRSSDYLGFSSLDLSAGWLYYWSREYSEPKVPDYIQGSTNFGLMKAMNKVGATTEARVPTDNVAPWGGITYTNEDFQIAKDYGILEYRLINPNPNDIKKAIYTGGPNGQPSPIISAYKVRTSFKESYDDGIVPNPAPGEKLLGGHSSTLIGWVVIDGIEYWVNFNSWGDDVGDGGKFYIRTDYPDFYPNDFWIIKHGEAEGVEPTPSTCPLGNGIATGLNFIGQGILRRSGSFQYVVEE